jgi:hypothetical protein
MKQDATLIREAVHRDGPELAHRDLCRNVEAVGGPALKRAAVIVVKRAEIETAGAELLDWTEYCESVMPRASTSK